MKLAFPFCSLRQSMVRTGGKQCKFARNYSEFYFYYFTSRIIKLLIPYLFEIIFSEDVTKYNIVVYQFACQLLTL